MALEKKEVFQKAQPKEKTKYESAKKLMDSVDCIYRFEAKVKSLEDAAKKFESLGDYEKASALAKECRAQAAKTKEEGAKQVFQNAISIQEQANCKSDYVSAIEEFNRVRKLAAYREEAKAHVVECKDAIRHLATIKTWKNRGIALLILVLIGAGLTQTPVYPIAKGMVHKSLGHYQVALSYYKSVDYFPGVSKLERACYYKLATQAMMAGEEKMSAKYFRLAWYYSDAPDYTITYEKRELEEAKKGETVFFGGKKWIVLDKKGSKRLLFSAHSNRNMAYDTKHRQVTWQASNVHDWLQNKCIDSNYLDLEREMMLPVLVSSQKVAFAKENDIEDKTYMPNAFLLSEKEYKQYQKYIPAFAHKWWLRDDVIESGKAKCVTPNGVANMPANDKSVRVYPALWVTVK